MHLSQTITRCNHPRIMPWRDTMLSIIQEAEKLSLCEMDDALSKQQFDIAQVIYQPIEMHQDNFRVFIEPVHLLVSNHGYRMLTLAHGVEFNELPSETPQDRKIREAVALSIVTLEFINLLKGGYFDCDRHGNQLRVEVDHEHSLIKVGLFDFGEMAINAPSQLEISQLAGVFKSIPWIAMKQKTTFAAVDNALTKEIMHAVATTGSASYLMRIRKSSLALHDFMQHLSKASLINALLDVCALPFIHPQLKAALSTSLIKDG